jgi:hypothetical protein
LESDRVNVSLLRDIANDAVCTRETRDSRHALPASGNECNTRSSVD